VVMWLCVCVCVEGEGAEPPTIISLAATENPSFGFVKCFPVKIVVFN